MRIDEDFRPIPPKDMMLK